MVTLYQSGKGVTPLDINSVRQLATSLGYTFEGEDDLEKKADLGAFFQHYGVTSLSAFKKLFYTTRLTESGIDERQEITSWEQQYMEGEHFVGQTVGRGLRQGLGKLRYQVGKSDAVYEGQFECGVKEGFGVLITTSGYKYEGHFQSDIMSGPGVFTYPRSIEESEKPAKFEGLFKGRPHGKGIYTLCSGAQDHGIFDGMQKTGSADVTACNSAAALARQYAGAARSVQHQVQSEVELRRKETALLEAPPELPCQVAQ